MNEHLKPKMPFVWPEPRVSARINQYVSDLPFEDAFRSADTLFGVISAIDYQAISWIEDFLTYQQDSKVRLVVAIYPTCRTTEADLRKLVQVAERYGARAHFKLYPERYLVDRSSNLLCVHSTDGTLAISTGPTENLGYAPASASHANVVMQVSAGAFEACRKWFDYLWGIAGPLRPEIAIAIPRLVVPKGDAEASRLWEAFREHCLDQSHMEQEVARVKVDPESGEVVLINQLGEFTASPTEEIGIPKLDQFAESVAQVFDLGVLVSIDRLSRIPPLEAPVKPKWFGVESFRQTGMVRARTSIKVAPFDEATIRKIDRLRLVSGELLPRYSFSLADGVRWIPRQAIPLFEAALTAANEDAKKLLGEVVGGSVEEFLLSRRDRIQADAQRMFEVYHPNDKIPSITVENILNELKIRLHKTRGDKIIPRVAYSPVAFDPSQSSDWSSPWGQAFALLKDIAEFPRQALTDRFFWQGIRTDEDALIEAMDVVGDILNKQYGTRQSIRQAEIELDLIKRLEESRGEAKDKCRALWDLITTGNYDRATALIDHVKQ